MRVWHFWHEFVTCVPAPSRAFMPQREREPKFGYKRKKLSFSFSFRESPEAYHDFFLPWLLSVRSSSKLFPSWTASAFHLAIENVCGFLYVYAQGGSLEGPYAEGFFFCIHGCIKVSFSLSLYIYTTLGSFHGKKEEDNKWWDKRGPVAFSLLRSLPVLHQRHWFASVPSLSSYSLAFLSQTNNAANRPDDGGVPIERHRGSSSRQKLPSILPTPKKCFICVSTSSLVYTYTSCIV